MWKIAESSGGGNQAGNADRVSSNVAKEPLRVALTAPSSHICQNCYVYLSKLVYVLVKCVTLFVKVAKCICKIFDKRAFQDGFNSAIKSHAHIRQSCHMYFSKLWQKRLSDGLNSTIKSPPVRLYHSSTQISLASILLRVFVLHFTTIKMK